MVRRVLHAWSAAIAVPSAVAASSTDISWICCASWDMAVRGRLRGRNEKVWCASMRVPPAALLVVRGGCSAASLCVASRRVDLAPPVLVESRTVVSVAPTIHAHDSARQAGLQRPRLQLQRSGRGRGHDRHDARRERGQRTSDQMSALVTSLD